MSTGSRQLGRQELGSAPVLPEAATTYQPLPWTSIKAEAKRIGVGPRSLYRAAAAGKLRAIPVNDRGDLKTLPQWVDEYLLSLQAEVP